jgi:hypothetical protein
MAKQAFPAGTTYRVVLKDHSHCVEITRPGAAPYVVIGFRTDAEAEAWIKQQRKETEIN